MSVQELAGESWREYVGEMSEDVRQTVALHSDVYIEGFENGYARGRADAMELPEVRAEELEEGKWYVCRERGYTGIEIAQAVGPNMRIGTIRMSQDYFTSFRGPLPLGGGE